MAGYLGTKAVLLSTTAADVTGNAEIGGDLTVGGNLTSDGLTVDGGAKVKTGTSGGSANVAANDFIVETSGSGGITISTPSTGAGTLAFGDESVSIQGRIKFDHTDNAMAFWTKNTTEAMRITADGSVGIGTSSIESDATVHIDGTDTTLLITEDSEGEATIRLGDTQGSLSQSFAISYDTGSEVANFVLDGTHRAMFNTAGDYIVGPTTAATPFTIYNANNDSTKAGVGLRYTGYFAAARYGDHVMQLNRMNSDGEILGFRKDGTTVGSIGSYFSNIYIGIGAVGLGWNSSGWIGPMNPSTLANRDNAIDLGASTVRFDDIYATNGTIQTSDRNEKQDIEVLSDAEQRVAVACKGLLRKFRWKDAVAEKGDDARIHFGIIAQDLQDAFTAEGLDAGRYAMFISSTWWETQTEVPAVEAVEAVEATYDEDGNELTPAVEAVEAKEAYTRTDTYETQEEAPEGATERTRLGVRYPELLAFIIGAM